MSTDFGKLLDPHFLEKWRELHDEMHQAGLTYTLLMFLEAEVERIRGMFAHDLSEVPDDAAERGPAASYLSQQRNRDRSPDRPLDEQVT